MPTLVFGLVAFTIVCCVVLGGGTRGGFLSDGLLQYLALPLLFVSIWKILDLGAGKGIKDRPFGRELAFCGALVLVPLFQLVPLPPFIWSALPGREPVRAAFELVGGGIPWMPISLSPEATWLSLLSLVPPLAIFLGCLLLGYRERRLMSLVVLAIGLVSVMLGLVQVSQGPSSALRFFEITNPSEAVGFFANRNHLAALLYTLTLLAAAWAVDAMFAAQWSGVGTRRYDAAAILPMAASFVGLIIVVSAQATARSRAGIGLTMVAVLGAVALAYWDPRAAASVKRGSARSKGAPSPAGASAAIQKTVPARAPASTARVTKSPARHLPPPLPPGVAGRVWLALLSWVTPAKLLVGATVFATLFSVQFALYRLMERFAGDPLDDARIPFGRNTIAAANAHMPFGSGLGSFVPVYAMFEKPQDMLVNGYANHAHDDILELWLETGLVGPILVAVFLVWFAFRAKKVWQTSSGWAAGERRTTRY